MRAEELARENRSLRREFLGSIERFWAWEIASGEVRVTQSVAAGGLGGSAESASTIQEWEASLHPEDRERVVGELADYLAHRSPRFHSEYRIRREGSAWKWVRDRGIAIWDKSGRAVRMTGAETDITLHRHAEAELGGRESRLRAVFASLTEGVVIMTMDGKIVQCNSSAERILGLARDEILGRTPRDPRWLAIREDGSALPGDERPSEITRRTGKSCTGTIMGVRTPDGELRWCSVNSQPLRATEDAPTDGVVVTFTDVTTIRRITEKLLESQKLESVARLAGGIAHDFNNLLTAVLGYAELGLGKVDPGSKLASYLAQIVHSGDMAANLTRQLLAFARRQPLRQEPIFLGDLLEQSLDIVRPWVGERIEVALNCESDLWPVLADQGQMQQVLLNLASNATDAMPDGGSLKLSLRNVVLREAGELAPGDYVEWSIADNGAGMPAAVAAHAFEPFFTTKDVGEGSGLGLATCYGIVRRHGGTIGVRSAVGEGSTFTILLPRAAQPCKRTAETA